MFIISPLHNEVHQASLNEGTKNIKIKACGYGLVGCDDVWFGRWVLNFRRNLLNWEYNEEVHQLFIDFKKAYDSVRREVLYKILIELVSLGNL